MTRPPIGLAVKKDKILFFLQILSMKREWGKLLYNSGKTRDAVDVFCTLTHDELTSFYKQPAQVDSPETKECKELTSR